MHAIVAKQFTREFLKKYKMTKVITRFAPSPTGYLHIGNARTAMINWLYARKHGGEFILRIDDTDTERSDEKYVHAIKDDLAWLGINYDATFNQLSRLDRYNNIKKQLIESGRLYPCFESEEELQMKRKIQLGSGKPPIYDRAALKLTSDQIDKLTESGKKPHYRFLINQSSISWQDMVKGEVKYAGEHLSDPVVIRENGSMTYMLCSCIDDIDYNISHIIRGEDHVTNTAIQMQMFEALSATPPELGHLSLVKAKDDKISKRIGGFEISSLRDELGFEHTAILDFFTLIGSSKQVHPFTDVAELIREFDIATYSKSPTIYQPQELERLNHKILINLSFEDVRSRLAEMGLSGINEQFWMAVRPNLQKLKDIKDWWEICHKAPASTGLDLEFLKSAALMLPEGEITEDTWGLWTSKLALETGKKGKELFMPLRLALTGMEQGPELKNLLPMIGRLEILKRLSVVN